MEQNLLRLLADLQEENKEAALITVLSSTASGSNCDPGAMMIINKEGDMLAGCVGADVFRKWAGEQGRVCIARGLSRKAVYNDEEVNIEVFIKSFCSQDQLIIVGAGTFALNAYKFARILGYRVTLFDDRPDILTKERFPEAHELILGDIIDNLRLYSVTENMNIVIATSRHIHDEEALGIVISSSARYIGVLGNRRRITGYFENLKSLNLPSVLLDRVHSPIGLDLGGKRTAEIGLAVIAEIQAVKYGRAGGSTKINIE